MSGGLAAPFPFSCLERLVGFEDACDNHHMSRWQALYESPTPFSAVWGHHRIFAPQAYLAVRNALTVPFVLDEAMGLARFFPLCWQQIEGRVHPVALLALKPGTARWPPYEALPLALRAYPFVIPEGFSGRLENLDVDRAIADQPTDIGAPILLDDGKFSTGARLRLSAAMDMARGLPAIDELTEDLETHGLLEPWPLHFDLGEAGRIARSDLYVLSAARLHHPALYAMIERHGALAGVFLGVHRASLFRINWLLNAARTPPAPAATAPGSTQATP